MFSIKQDSLKSPFQKISEKYVWSNDKVIEQ